MSYIVRSLATLCDKFVFVVSPVHAKKIDAAISKELLHKRYRLVMQEEPIGMADAVWRGLKHIKTQDVLIMWGDQPAVSYGTISQMFSLHALHNATVTMPVVDIENPYTALVRENNRVYLILQAREGDVMPDKAESDIGVFLCRTLGVKEQLDYLLKNCPAVLLGTKTKELNFLPVLPYLAKNWLGGLRTFTVPQNEKTGLNTPEDEKLLCRIL